MSGDDKDFTELNIQVCQCCEDLQLSKLETISIPKLKTSVTMVIDNDIPFPDSHKHLATKRILVHHAEKGHIREWADGLWPFTKTQEEWCLVTATFSTCPPSKDSAASFRDIWHGTVFSSVFMTAFDESLDHGKGPDIVLNIARVALTALTPARAELQGYKQGKVATCPTCPHQPAGHTCRPDA